MNKDTQTITYRKSDCGCYIDGAYGEGHMHARLAELVRPFAPAITDDLISCAYNSERAQELIDDATDVLNEHVVEGLCFYWYAGDLILGTIEDAEA